MMMGSATLVALYAWFIAVRLTEQQRLGPHGISAFNCFDPKLPNVTIFATGGTIAGSAISGKDMSKYQIGSLGVEALIYAVPELCAMANIRGVQIANIGSHDIDSNVLVHMAQEIQRDLDNPYAQGVVVTHGTDTLEETAFFLDLTVKSEKPIVTVGSMRPATAISADGPLNLLSAVALAVSESGRNRGVMTVMNDRIGAARFMSKTNANRVDSFRAVEQGYLGVFDNTQPVFFHPPSRPLGHRHFDISNSSTETGLPKVDILYGHQGLEPRLFKSAVDFGARGVVLAGVGAGWWPTLAREHVDAVAERSGVAVMTSSRTMAGYVDDSSGGVGCGFLDPQRCRIQLQLCLEEGLSLDEITDLFQIQGQQG
ncbi:hypothetical protein ACO1O0_001002 [Amphichorda felina]